MMLSSPIFRQNAKSAYYTKYPRSNEKKSHNLHWNSNLIVGLAIVPNECLLDPSWSLLKRYGVRTPSSWTMGSMLCNSYLGAVLGDICDWFFSLHVCNCQSVNILLWSLKDYGAADSLSEIKLLFSNVAFDSRIFWENLTSSFRLVTIGSYVGKNGNDEIIPLMGCKFSGRM